MVKSFEDVLYKLDRESYYKYRSFVEKIKPALAFQQGPFDTYSGETHIRRVIQNIDLLIPDKYKEDLSGIELYLLLVATWLHDIGKIREFDSSKSYGEQLAEHADRGFECIIKNSIEFGLDEKEALIIAYIVKGHGLLDISELPDKKGLGYGEAIDIRKLAAILRLADDLDIEYGRVPNIVKEISGIKPNEKWNIRASIDGIEIKPDSWDIVIYCTPREYDVLEDIKNTSEWIRSKLSDIRGELQKLGLYYKTIDLQVDDIYLQRIQSEEKYNIEAGKTIQRPALENDAKLCPLTGYPCPSKFEPNELMVFVGIPFSNDFIDIYTLGIKWALDSLQLKPWRADEEPSTGPIFCKICGAIRECRTAIIDISEPNPNVMFELGMLSTLGKRVVLIKNHEKKVPSDLAGFEYIQYRNIIDLREQLIQKIPKILDI